MYEAGRGRVTDTIISVPSLDDAAAFWEGALGLGRVDGGDGWVLFEDGITRQRISLVAGDFGASWAVAVATRDFDATLTHLRVFGGRAGTVTTTQQGLRTALCHDPAGVAILVYEDRLPNS